MTNKLTNTLAVALTMLMALPAGVNAQTIEDDYYQYEVTSATECKVIGFSTKFSDFNSDGSISLTKWGAAYTDPIYEGERLDIKAIGDYAFSPENPLYASWPEGKELCEKIIQFDMSWSILTYIGDGAFKGCSKLGDVSLSNASYPRKPVTYIGEHAFDGTNLYSVYWNDDVPVIPAYCFANTPNLKVFNFYDTMGIGDGAFQNSAIESVEFPVTLKEVGHLAFSGSSQLKGFNCTDEDPQDVEEDAFGGIPGDAVLVVPQGTESKYKACKGWNVFGDRIQSLSMVDKPVSDDYFSYRITGDAVGGGDGTCTITGLAPGSNRTVFFDWQISGGISVTDPAGVTHWYTANAIDLNAFRNSDISRMELNNTSILYIGDKAFMGSKSLSYVTLPSGLYEVGDQAFEGCTNLYIPSMPEEVYYVGQRAFANSGVQNILVNSSMTNIELQTYADCANLKDVVIPDNVNFIMDEAFSGSSIETLTFNSPTMIYDDAFAFCKKLRLVRSTISDPCSIPENVFQGVADGAVLIVPEGTADTYIDRGWTRYLTLRELGTGTGIDGVTEQPVADRAFDLQGRAIEAADMQQLPKGIYVVKGRKMVVK